MFDVGFWELALIGAVALIIVGPERLPGVAHTVGLWVGKARRMVRDVKADIDREIREHKVVDADELKKDFADIKNAAGATGESLRKTFEEASPLGEKEGAGSGDEDEDEKAAPQKAAKSPTGRKKTAKKTVSRKKTAKKATSRKRVAKKTAKPPADSATPASRKKTAKKTAKRAAKQAAKQAVNADVDAPPPPPTEAA